MKATDVLIEEHRVIERVLDALGRAVEQLEKEEPVRPEFFLSAADFIRGFADGCHHQKEEGVLFHHMQAQGMPTEGCPLGVMYAEHELGRQYTRAMISGAQGVLAGDLDDRNRIIQSASSYIALLRRHIFREDNILFPMSHDVIPALQHAQVEADFALVEQAEIAEGVHEKYLALAQVLEDEVSTGKQVVL